MAERGIGWLKPRRPWRCSLGFHRWEWDELPEAVPLIQRSIFGDLGHSWAWGPRPLQPVWQTRRCQDCSHVERDLVKRPSAPRG